MKRIVSFLLAAFLVLSVAVVASADEAAEGVGTYGTDWVRYGDVNVDETINAKDALSMLKNAVGKEVFTDVQKIIANVNGDDAINAKDALDVLKLSVGKIGKFSVGIFYQITAADEDPVNDYIASYDKNNSVNAAYEKDPTADTSFSLDISGLAPNTIYSLSSGVWSDQEGVANTNDMKRLVFSLQGLINRDFGMDANHTTLIYVAGGTDDNPWLN